MGGGVTVPHHLNLNYESKVYIIPYRRATWCIHRQQWEEEVTGVWQHWLRSDPSSHHVTVTDQQFCMCSARAEQSSKQYATKSIVVRTWSIRQMFNQLVQQRSLSTRLTLMWAWLVPRREWLPLGENDSLEFLSVWYSFRQVYRFSRKLCIIDLAAAWFYDC